MKIIKGVWRIPAKQQYSYLEIEVEGSVDEIINGFIDASNKYLSSQNKKDLDEEPFKDDEFSKGKMTLVQQNN